ncbi:MAG: DUF1289 domain-containing protein [Paracoccaceae bacterium]
MTDEIWRRDEIESPCVKICVIHEESGLCLGCFRTRAEIAGWSRLAPDQRRETMAALPARETALIRRPRRGRAARKGSSTG